MKRERSVRPNPPFTKILSSLLLERKVRVREAASVAGVSPSTITNWTAGALPQDFMAVKKLASHLGTTLSFLLTGEHEAAPESPLLVSEVFQDGGVLFDGYAQVHIKKLVPRAPKNRTRSEPRNSTGDERMVSNSIQLLNKARKECE